VKRSTSLNTSISIAGEGIQPSKKLKLLGVTFDASLNFNDHVTNTCRSVNFQLKALKHIRKYLDQKTANIVACSIVGSRLDYCNSLMAGITCYNMKRLQRLQIHAAKIVYNDYKNAQSRFISELHWLPIP